MDGIGFPFILAIECHTAIFSLDLSLTVHTTEG